MEEMKEKVERGGRNSTIENMRWSRKSHGC